MHATPTTKRILLYSALVSFSVVSIVVVRIVEYNHFNFSRDGMREGLSNAVRADDLVAMRLFLLLGVDPDKMSIDSWERSLLLVTVNNGSVRATNLLLDYGAHPNGAIEFEGTEIAPVLMDREMLGSLSQLRFGPVFDALADPLAQAALRNEKEIFDLLRARGAQYGVVAAIAMNDEPFARNALDQNQDVRQAIRDISWDFLAIAQECKNTEAVKLLRTLDLVSPESEYKRSVVVF